MACRDNNCTSVHTAACMLVRPSTAEAGPCPVTKTCLTRWARQVFLLVWFGEGSNLDKLIALQSQTASRGMYNVFPSLMYWIRC